MDKLETLIDLLTRGALERTELSRRYEQVRDAVRDPELAWMHGDEEKHIRQAALLLRLQDVALTSGKLDELHERISESFEEPLPPFPSDRKNFWSEDYFEWLDEIVAARGYAVMMLPDSFNDELAALVIKRQDMPRVLALAEELELIVEKSTQRRYA
ncbi:hypothetical protein RKE25_14565 [Dyella sp. BiH032]|uniref:hypothetical protein n=1 Tax=Dyella sp. BiH032 TaxID=3075430 RepID=UPI0028935C8C|nr:hypothetical protein [Dyella sp. BiH032]WNL44641.1 hypothetical protein RKE25_14565 [Dyella sp. BiH032]